MTRQRSGHFLGRPGLFQRNIHRLSKPKKHLKSCRKCFSCCRPSQADLRAFACGRNSGFANVWETLCAPRRRNSFPFCMAVPDWCSCFQFGIGPPLLGRAAIAAYGIHMMWNTCTHPLCLLSLSSGGTSIAQKMLILQSNGQSIGIYGIAVAHNWAVAIFVCDTNCLKQECTR